MQHLRRNKNRGAAEAGPDGNSFHRRQQFVSGIRFPECFRREQHHCRTQTGNTGKLRGGEASTGSHHRMRGARLGIWQKAYNNTVTGEYHTPVAYPEFKGYHGDLYWATLLSDRMPLTVCTETEGLYLRVFTPEEPRDREDRGLSVKRYPEGDLSFLLEIPAVSSQGMGGEPSSVKVNKGDEGCRVKLWFGCGE